MVTQDQQNPASNQLEEKRTVIIVDRQKSLGLAFLLAFFFGPLGLLYASVTGGIVMLILGVIIALITFGVGLIFVWIGSVIWAVVAVNNANKSIG